MLELKSVTIHYPQAATPAVKDANLEVHAGEIMALLGPSGCGKSSILRAVAGLEDYQGEIAWQTQNLRGVAVHERGFGLMFQEGQLFPHRSVGGNVAFGLQMAKVPRGEQRKRVNELLDLVGLSGYANRRVATLSGGEQQRVALARSLAPRPKLLLLDEPLSALDRHLRDRLATELRDILTATKTTALYVTHDQDEAFTIADRIVLMRNGKLIQSGRPTQVWANPVDAWAAEFLGYRLVTPSLALGPRALHIANGQATHSGVVAGISMARGEIIAHVDLPDWGVQPVISPHPVEQGERVGVVVDDNHLCSFNDVVPG